jgi:tetratricopeptide (TPR) repeat protein
LRGAVAACLVFLAFWPPFASGAYFPTAQYVAVLHASGAFILVLILGGVERRPLVLTPARVGAVALLGAYMLSSAVAIAPREAVQGILKYGIYTVVFLAVSEVVRSAQAARDQRAAPPLLARLAGFSGLSLGLWAAVAVFGLVNLVGAAGIVALDVMDRDRLFTLLTYPNSAASAAGAALLLGLGLQYRLGASPQPFGTSLSRLMQGTLSVGQWSLFTVVILTMSRGAWLVLPVALALTLVLWPSGRRLAPLASFTLTGLVALGSALALSAWAGGPVRGLVILASSMLLAVTAGATSRLFASQPARRQAIAVLATAVLAMALVGALVASDSLPPALRQRLSSFSLSEQSAWGRLAWSRDALAIVKDYPILGLGGGGWASRYFQYQSYGYFTRQVHNDFAQIWVETGTVGLLALLAFLAGSAYALIRLVRGRGTNSHLPTGLAGSPGSAALLAGLGGAAAMLALHSLMDFNLAIAAVGILLWAVLGVIDGLWAFYVSPPPAEPVRPTKKGRRAARAQAPPADFGWPRLAGLGAALCLSTLALFLWGGANASARAGELLAELKYAESRAGYARAAALDPWSPQIRQDSVRPLERLFAFTEDTSYLAEAREHLRKACRLDPYNPYLHAHYGAFALRYGDRGTAVLELEKALELHPFDPRRYEQVAQVYLIVGRHYLEEGSIERARDNLVRSVGVLQRLASQSEKVPSFIPEAMAFPSLTPAVALYSGQALALLGRWDEAQYLLAHAHTAKRSLEAGETQEAVSLRQAEAALWLALLAERAGDSRAADRFMEQARRTLSSADTTLTEVRPLLGQAGAP